MCLIWITLIPPTTTLLTVFCSKTTSKNARFAGQEPTSLTITVVQKNSIGTSLAKPV